jgi:hypothetical protein
MSIEAEVTRGAHAERLLNDPLLKEAFELVENHILAMFRNAPLRDSEGVVKSKQLLHSLSLVRGALEQAVRDGKVAAHTLEERKRGVSWLGDVWQSRRQRK